MKPAQHDYLPDVIAARRHQALRESTLIDAGVFAGLTALCGLFCAVCPDALLWLFGLCTAVCTIECAANLIRFQRLGKARP